MDDREGQQPVGVPPLPPFDFCPVEEGFDHVRALAAHQILNHVQPAEVGHSASRIITAYISLLNRTAGPQLGTLDVTGGDVLLGGEEPESLEVADLLSNMLIDRGGQVRQFSWEGEAMLMNDHVHLVRLQQGFSAL